MTELPKKIIVNRIPYSVCNSNDPYSYEADPGVQEIRVTQEAAPARKRQYFMWEVAHLLLVSAGMSQKEADKYHAGVGSVLNRLVIDNDTDFVKGRKPVPSMIWINGLPYTVQQGIFKELQDEDLDNYIAFTLEALRRLGWTGKVRLNRFLSVLTTVSEEATNADDPPAYANQIKERFKKIGVKAFTKNDDATPQLEDHVERNDDK